MANSKTLIKKINNFIKEQALISLVFLLLAISLLLINYSEIDVQIQNYLFDFTHKKWLIDRNDLIKKFFFYSLPKILFGFLATFYLLALVYGFYFFKKKKRLDFFTKNRHHFFATLLGLALIPMVAGNIKKFTNVYCPTQLEIYDGDKPYIKIFSSYPQNFYQAKQGQCFPAGHAVTGFSLFIFFLLNLLILNFVNCNTN
jgi:membrane-associated PAP2 superfamily phosphatase